MVWCRPLISFSNRQSYEYKEFWAALNRGEYQAAGSATQAAAVHAAPSKRLCASCRLPVKEESQGDQVAAARY